MQQCITASNSKQEMLQNIFFKTIKITVKQKLCQALQHKEVCHNFSTQKSCAVTKTTNNLFS